MCHNSTIVPRATRPLPTRPRELPHALSPIKGPSVAAGAMGTAAASTPHLRPGVPRTGSAALPQGCLPRWLF